MPIISVCLYTSGAQLLGDKALEAPSEDRDERDRNEGDEVLLRALEDGVQPPVAAEPGEGPFDHPADAGGNELSVPAAGKGLGGEAERVPGFRQPLAPVAEIAEGWALEAAIGKRTLNRHDGFRVVPVRRCDIDRQRDAVFVDRHLDLDAADLLAAVNAARKTARRRAAGAAVDACGARLRTIPAGEALVAAQPVKQSAPEAKAGPPSEQSEERVEGDVAQKSDGPPLHATEANAPDRHHRLAQRRSGQRRLGPRTHRSAAILCHGLEFRQHFVDEGVDVSERIPRARRGFCGADGGSHARTSMLLPYADRVRCSPVRAPRAIRPIVAIEPEPVSSCSLQTDTYTAAARSAYASGARSSCPSDLSG